MNFYRIFFYFLHKKRKRETNIFKRRQIPCHQRNQSYNCTEWFTWMTLGIGWLSFFSSFPREKEHIMMLLLFSLNHAYSEKKKGRNKTRREERTMISSWTDDVEQHDYHVAWFETWRRYWIRNKRKGDQKYLHSPLFLYLCIKLAFRWSRVENYKLKKMSMTKGDNENSGFDRCL